MTGPTKRELERARIAQLVAEARAASARGDPMPVSEDEAWQFAKLARETLPRLLAKATRRQSSE